MLTHEAGFEDPTEMGYRVKKQTELPPGTSGTITVAFQASDDVGLALVLVQGEGTGNAELDAGLVFACENTICAGTRPVTLSLTALGITPTAQISTTLLIVGVARDSTGQESSPQELRVLILPRE